MCVSVQIAVHDVAVAFRVPVRDVLALRADLDVGAMSELCNLTHIDEDAEGVLRGLRAVQMHKNPLIEECLRIILAELSL